MKPLNSLFYSVVVITVKFHERYSVNEDDGIVQPLLVLSNPSSFVETVQVISSDVTANGEVANYCKLCLYSNVTGSDYNFGPYSVAFPIGSTNASFNITIIDDNVLEDDEMFNISITSITNGHIVGTPAVATVTILDTTGKCHNYVMYYCVYVQSSTVSSGINLI